MIQYEPDGHRYYLADDKGTRLEEIPGVSAVLKSAGVIDTTWFTPEAAERGRHIHRACALWDQGVLDESTVDPSYRGYVEAWRFFRLLAGVDILEIEPIVGDEVLRYGGRADRVIRWNGKTMILDIKTGGPELWHKTQVGAYCLAKRLTAGVTVYTQKTGKIKLEFYKPEVIAAEGHNFRAMLDKLHHGAAGLWGGVGA